jgi:hypothetical protein
MRDCADDNVKDVLPELVAGRLAEPERARVAAHVASCASCAAEVAIIRAAERAMTAATPAVDVSRIVRALPTPVVPLAARRQPPRRRVSWRIAATIATIAVCGVSIGVVQGILRDDGHKPPHVPRTVSQTKPADQTEASGLSVGGNLNDLSASQMKALLDKMDELDAVPSAEPQPAVSGMRAATGVQ